METLYEMVWRLYEGEEDTAEICPDCGNLVDDCTCDTDPRCSECERFPCQCEE